MVVVLVDGSVEVSGSDVVDDPAGGGAAVVVAGVALVDVSNAPSSVSANVVTDVDSSLGSDSWLPQAATRSTPTSATAPTRVHISILLMSMFSPPW
ncbi:MAG: hypothetical protein QNJ71_11020 [Acidimicrobiia bacterium]|nr:hypothetical protein [Acidimicrobiia bacterium]